MRSGITVYVHPWSLCPPSITTVVLPAPDTRAPQAFRKFCKSVISGSLAALQMEVVPSAPQAASIRFSVAPTEGRLSTISLPRSRAARQWSMPPASSISAPSVRNPDRCRSMGRGPSSHPPRCDTLWCRRCHVFHKHNAAASLNPHLEFLRHGKWRLCGKLPRFIDQNAVKKRSCQFLGQNSLI